MSVDRLVGVGGQPPRTTPDERADGRREPRRDGGREYDHADQFDERLGDDDGNEFVPWWERERQREGDERQERLDERPGVDDGRDGGADEEPQVRGQREELREHQGRRRRRESFGVAAREMREGDHVADTRRQENEQRTGDHDRIG